MISSLEVSKKNENVFGLLSYVTRIPTSIESLSKFDGIKIMKRNYMFLQQIA